MDTRKITVTVNISEHWCDALVSNRDRNEWSGPVDGFPATDNPEVDTVHMLRRVADKLEGIRHWNSKG